jgi:SPOR domain
LAAPEEEEFVYHAHRPGQPMDPAIRKMALGAGGVSVLVIVVALLWSGVRTTGFGAPPVISAPPGPIRVLPSNPGGLTVPGADVQIMSGDDSNAPPQLAPAAPAPEISQLDQAAGVGTPVPVPVAPPPVAAPENAQAQVQLAATADEPGAESVWNGLKAKMPDLFSGKTPEILPAVVNGQSIWRLRLGGFADADDAKAFCASVKAKGADCTVAAF